MAVSARPSKSVKRLRDLDLARIADAALALVDQQGAEAFTMRAVANALGVTPMALYNHVADKSALAQLLLERVLNEIPLPPTTNDWRDDLLAMAHWIRETTLSHPAVTQLRGEFRLRTPTTLQVTERWLGLWQRSGLEFDKTVTAARNSRTAVVGFVMEELTQRQIHRPDEAMLSALPNARLLFETQADPDADFEFSVRCIIDGIHASLRST